MVGKALSLHLEAKPGREGDVAAFLRELCTTVEGEPGTAAAVMFQHGPTSFGVFGAFDDEAAREAHLAGPAAALLRAAERDGLFARRPELVKADVVAAKLPA